MINFRFNLKKSLFIFIFFLFTRGNLYSFESSFTINIDRITNLPEEYCKDMLSLQYHFYVKIKVFQKDNLELVKQKIKTKKHIVEGDSILFGQDLRVQNVLLDDQITIQLIAQKANFKFEVGNTAFEASDLIRKKNREIVFTEHNSSQLVFNRAKTLPMLLSLSIDKDLLAAEWQEHVDQESHETYPKHVFVVTRGTRGDVQPFIALARGLAEQLGWRVTICTELRYKPLVKRYAKVRRGRISFRPSGGDTEKRIDRPLAKWAMHRSNSLIQATILAFSEREFFDAEPAFYYWAKTMEPDLLLFSFITANIAMVLSESLEIPMIGFILQPTVIPSGNYPPFYTNGNLISEKEPDPSHDLERHRFHKYYKKFLENGPLFSRALDAMRKRRGLKPFGYKTWDYKVIHDQNIPMIVPIHPYCFGGRPDDWSENTILTDFIYLRSEASPLLDMKLEQFIANAKALNEPLVVMAFSSMPVSRKKILKLASSVINLGKAKAHVIALTGNRPINEKVNSKLEAAIKIMKEENRLFEASGAPYDRLFPLVDFIIMHGGLGTTSEVLQAGIPTAVTGVLLMDQRFWGKRVQQMGVGPGPVSIKHFSKNVVRFVDDAVTPNNVYFINAKKIAGKIKPSSSDGVKINVDALLKFSEIAKPVERYR